MINYEQHCKPKEVVTSHSLHGHVKGDKDNLDVECWVGFYSKEVTNILKAINKKDEKELVLSLVKFNNALNLNDKVNLDEYIKAITHIAAKMSEVKNIDFFNLYFKLNPEKLPTVFLEMRNDLLLNCAVQRNNKDLVKYLLEAGLKDKSDRYLITSAVKGKVELCKEFLNHTKTPITVNDGGILVTMVLASDPKRRNNSNDFCKIDLKEKIHNVYNLDPDGFESLYEKVKEKIESGASCEEYKKSTLNIINDVNDWYKTNKVHLKISNENINLAKKLKIK